MYKYLGIELKSGLSFKQYKEKILKEARTTMMRVWAMGMRESELLVEDCVRVWQALVRPLLEYGVVVGKQVGRRRESTKRWEE
jgi:hypothetical protein